MNFDFIRILSGPVIGAAIGYCTNWIAVKMLFRPLKPVYLFGHQLPFTPGIIPRGQARLARAAGNVVGNTLLQTEDLKHMLLSDAAKEQLRERLTREMEQQSDRTVREACQMLMGDGQYAAASAVLQDRLTEKVSDRVLDMGLGELAAREVLNAVRQRLSNSFLGMMIRDDMLAGFAEPIEEAVDRYLNENIDVLLEPQMQKLWSDAENGRVSDFVRLLREAQLDPVELMMQLYERMITERAESLLSILDLRRLTEQKILAMQPEELETLVLSIMKKELRAIVNLGAVIGFVLGLLNLLF